MDIAGGIKHNSRVYRYGVFCLKIPRRVLCYGGWFSVAKELGSDAVSKLGRPISMATRGEYLFWEESEVFFALPRMQIISRIINVLAPEKLGPEIRVSPSTS